MSIFKQNDKKNEDPFPQFYKMQQFQNVWRWVQLNFYQQRIPLFSISNPSVVKNILQMLKIKLKTQESVLFLADKKTEKILNFMILKGKIQHEYNYFENFQYFQQVLLSNLAILNGLKIIITIKNQLYEKMDALKELFDFFLEKDLMVSNFEKEINYSKEKLGQRKCLILSIYIIKQFFSQILISYNNQLNNVKTQDKVDYVLNKRIKNYIKTKDYKKYFTIQNISNYIKDQNIATSIHHFTKQLEPKLFLQKLFYAQIEPKKNQSSFIIQFIFLLHNLHKDLMEDFQQKMKQKKKIKKKHKNFFNFHQQTKQNQEQQIEQFQFNYNIQQIVCDLKSSNFVKQTKGQNLYSNKKKKVLSTTTHDNSISDLSDQENMIEIQDESPFLKSLSESQNKQNKQFTYQQEGKQTKELNKEKQKPKQKLNYKKMLQLIAKKTFRYIVNQEIIKFTSDIIIKSQELIPIRNFIFNNIRCLLSMIFPLQITNIIVYGSCVTGLSLKQSDIDILLQTYHQKQNHISVLKQVCKQLQKTSLFKNSKILDKAFIPVIKFEVPLIFFDVKMQNKFLTIDIAIEQKENIQNYLGIKSTQYIQQVMKNYPNIMNVVLLLKYVLKSRSLNSTYKGGINSYCLFIMIYAYFLKNKVKQTQENSDLIVNILTFYGKVFNFNKFRIDLTMNQQYYLIRIFVENEIQSQVVIIIDPINERVMTRNAYKFQQIQDQFKKWLQQFQKIKEMIIEELCKLKKQEIKKLYQLDIKECFKFDLFKNILDQSPFMKYLNNL